MRPSKIIYLLNLLPILLMGQEIPPILQFPPSVYKAENQNWAVAQDANKYIYVANNEGLLEYNGAEWTLYPSPNKTILRSVEVLNDRVYTSCFMEFGYWKRNDTGQLEYTSLSGKIRSQIQENEIFWTIKSFENWVLFQSTDRIYIYDFTDDKFSILTDSGNYYRIFRVNQEIIIQKKDSRLYKIEKGREILFAEIPREFNIELILNIFPDSDGYILLTRNRGFFKVKNGTVSKWHVEADNELERSKIFSAIRLKNKDFVLGTISKGIIRLTADGKIINTLNQTNGLSNNTVLSLFEDVDGNVWAGLDNGIDCLNIPSFIKEYNDPIGTFGTLYCSILYNKNLYFGTNQGLFYKSANSNEPLKFIKGTEGQVWSLFEHGGELFCGHATGTFLIQNNEAILISSIAGTWGFRDIQGKPQWLLQGNYSGLVVLSKETGRWKLRNEIEGFENSTRFFEIMDDGKIWVNHESKGVFRLTPNKDLTKFEDVKLIDNIPKGKGSGLLKVKNNLLYGYEKGIFELDTTSQKFIRDSVLSMLIPENQYVSGKMVSDQNARLWAFNKTDIAYAQEGSVSDKSSIRLIPIQYFWRKVTVSFENISQIDNNKYLVGKTNGFLELDIEAHHKQPHKVFLNAIQTKERDTLLTLVSQSENGNFKYQQGSIKFSFNVPAYNKYDYINFQYILEGYHQTWSDWTESSDILFEKLPFGDYTFKVRSRIGNTISDNIATYQFKINRPFLLSNIAIAGYILCLITIMILTHKFYKRHYLKQHQKIMADNQREMDMRRMIGEQEIIHLKNEKLHQEVESKNRELAITMMSIVKRNEVLKNIKKELKTNTNFEENTIIFKLIDKNLDNSEDRKLLEEAFNNIDMDFINRAKEKHTDLSHNDFKFCAYLRLNLSSKEIASLLNISTKSVEVRRFRLRKKLGVPHDMNLTDYIISL
ncbi:MAG: LuxR C-terminal-related transcriptional regulator [Flavobacteriaceae bacterium]|nr:LuxR C-terminal-related transcriptional regulator [Flavobacteriaceae bacterium]